MLVVQCAGKAGKSWLGASVLALAASAAGQPAPPTGARQYEIPLILPASHPTAEGFVRIVNLSAESATRHPNRKEEQ